MNSDELTNMMEDLLRPCPWCGAKARFMHAPESWVQCSKCNAQTGMRSYEINAVKDWNRMCPTDEEKLDTALDAAFRSVRRAVVPDRFESQHYISDAEAVLGALCKALKTNDWTEVDKAVERAYYDLENVPQPKSMEDVERDVARMKRGVAKR